MKLYLPKLTGKVFSVLLFMDFFKIVFWPNLDLIFWAMLCIIVDLITGMLKAGVQGKFVVSAGIKMTLLKLAQYCGSLAMAFILTNVMTHDPDTLKNLTGIASAEKVKMSLQYVNNLILFLIIYTESLSISENLMVIDTESKFNKFVLKPIHALLTLAIVANPIKRFADTHAKGK